MPACGACASRADVGELLLVDMIEHRLELFIAWHGEVPPEARRLEEYEGHRCVSGQTFCGDGRD
jgi:hypothetical protein